MLARTRATPLPSSCTHPCNPCSCSGALAPSEPRRWSSSPRAPARSRSRASRPAAPGKRWPSSARASRPKLVALGDEAAAERLAPRLPPGTRLLRGRGALEQIARECEYDVAVHGVVGAAGLPASVAVLERGKTLALANKGVAWYWPVHC